MFRMVGRSEIGNVSLWKGKFNASFPTIRRLATELHRDTGISLTIRGKALMNMKTISGLVETLKGFSMKQLEKNLSLFSDAVEHYRARTSGIFNGEVGFVSGEGIEIPLEIEVPLIDGSNQRIVTAWVKEMLLSNIYMLALGMKEGEGSLGVDIKFQGCSMSDRYTIRNTSTFINSEPNALMEILLTLLHLEEAMDKGKVPIDEVINLENVSGTVLALVEGQKKVEAFK